MSKLSGGRNRLNAVRLSLNEGLEHPLQALFCFLVGVGGEPNRIRDHGPGSRGRKSVDPGSKLQAVRSRK